MNCRPGDLAYVTGCHTHPELNGMYMTVVSAVSDVAWLCSGCEVEAIAARYGVPPHVLDKYLRPIRDNDGADETMAWAGKPEQVPA